jgi:4-hydroxybenzoate polyprenyltransferase
LRGWVGPALVVTLAAAAYFPLASAALPGDSNIEGLLFSANQLSPQLLLCIAAWLLWMRRPRWRALPVRADRATGYDTFPVHFGMKTSAILSDVFAGLAVIGCATVLLLIRSENGLPGIVIATLFAAVGIGSAILSQIRLHKVTDDSEAHHAINPVVHAYILLLSAVAVAQQPAWAILLLIFYAAFAWTMKMRPAAHQI